VMIFNSMVVEKMEALLVGSQELLGIGS